MRKPRDQETYELECAFCNRQIEIAVKAVPYKCPHCGTNLQIEWRHSGSGKEADGATK